MQVCNISVGWQNHVELISSSSCQFYMVLPPTRNPPLHSATESDSYIFDQYDHSKNVVCSIHADDKPHRIDIPLLPVNSTWFPRENHTSSTERPFLTVRLLKKMKVWHHVVDKPRELIPSSSVKSMVFSTTKNHHSFKRKRPTFFCQNDHCVKNAGLSSRLMWPKPRRIDIFIIRSILHGFHYEKPPFHSNRKTCIFFGPVRPLQKCRSVIR